MKITDIKTFIAENLLRSVLIVKVETDEGYYGLGESALVSRELATQGVIAHFREFLIGKNPMRIGDLWQEMYRGQYFEGGRIFTGAISAIDIALYDLVGKKLGVPVYQLLGGAQRDSVPCFVSTHMGSDVVENTKRLVKEGWSVIRFIFGGPEEDKFIFEPRESIAITAERLIKAREAVGRGPVLGIDYHHRLTIAEAASFCQMLPPGTLDFLEEPIRAENPDAYAALRQMTPIPLAIGEECSSKWTFAPFVERSLTNFARVELCGVGGFTEAMKVAGWCETHYIDLMPHNAFGPIATAANIHLGAAVPNYAWLELPITVIRSFDKELFSVQPHLEGTSYPVPTTPGLGVEFNEELANQPLKFWEAPHFHRRDGSYTNW